MSTTLRIASLDCDIPVPNVYAERGFYSDIFEALLKDAAKTELEGLDLDIKVRRYECLKGELPSQQELGDIDGIIVTGSISSTYDDLPWIHSLISFLRETYNHHPRIKLFGSCFGHQVLAQSIFSSNEIPVVSKDPAGYEIGVHPVTLTPSFLSHFGPVTSNPSSPSLLRIQFIHADRVVLSPSTMAREGFENIGRTEHCSLQGIWKAGRVLTYQGHAEFDRFVNEETAKYFGTDSWSQEFIDSAVQAARRDDDGIWAAGVMLKFFTDSDIETDRSEEGGIRESSDEDEAVARF